VQDVIPQVAGQHESPPELEELPPELDEVPPDELPGPELDERPPELEEPLGAPELDEPAEPSG
jgi:hypothetical protein